MIEIVAEIGSNHDGRLDRALELIDAAAGAGANAVKLQCLPPLEPDWWPELQHAAIAERGIDLFASVFDPDAVRMLVDAGVSRLKIASTELVYDELVEIAAATGLPLIVSTGAAALWEVRRAIRIIGRARTHPNGVTLMQCTVRYPSPAGQVNLRAMRTMREAFRIPVGLSDHTMSVTIPAAATALGAVMIEKHLTISRDLDGPDHPYALEPGEFRAMVDNIREVEQALGDGRKDGPRDGELIEARGRRLRWREPMPSC